MIFPALLSIPSFIDTQFAFNTITVEFDGGYKETRERNTRDVKKFTVEYRAIPRADKNLLLNHFSTCKGSTPFNWTNSDDDTDYTVRYVSPIKAPADASTPGLYNVTLELEEV